MQIQTQQQVHPPALDVSIMQQTAGSPAPPIKTTSTSSLVVPSWRSIDHGEGSRWLPLTSCLQWLDMGGHWLRLTVGGPDDSTLMLSSIGFPLSGSLPAISSLFQACGRAHMDGGTDSTWRTAQVAVLARGETATVRSELWAVWEEVWTKSSLARQHHTLLRHRLNNTSQHGHRVISGGDRGIFSICMLQKQKNNSEYEE